MAGDLGVHDVDVFLHGMEHFGMLLLPNRILIPRTQVRIELKDGVGVLLYRVTNDAGQMMR